jgi:hypothetical protein
MKKGLGATLAAFRDEWKNKPDEVSVCVCEWVSVCESVSEWVSECMSDCVMGW